MIAEDFALKAASEFPSFMELRLRNITHKRRFVFDLEKKIKNFMQEKGMRIAILYGLRGTGKTVGMLQIAAMLRENFFYVRGDELAARGVDLMDLVDALDKIAREKIGFDKRYVLLIDEVTYIDNWDLKIKVLHDKRPNLMLVLTSSSSLALAFPPDIARRSSTVMVPPLTFREYLLLKHRIDIPDKLSKRLFGRIEKGESPREEFYEVLKIMGRKSAAGIFEDYLHADMPLSLRVSGEEYLEGLKAMIKKVVYFDFPRYGKVEASVLPKAEQMIFFLSQIPADAVRIDKLAAYLNISKETVVKLLGMLEKSMVISGLEAHGRRKALRMPKKWVFTSPSIRYALARGLGIESDLLGNIREDVVYTHLSTAFSDIHYSHEADFIILDKKMAFEVGGKKRERLLPGFTTYTLTSEEKIEGNRIPLFLFTLAF